MICCHNSACSLDLGSQTRQTEASSHCTSLTPGLRLRLAISCKCFGLSSLGFGMDFMYANTALAVYNLWSMLVFSTTKKNLLFNVYSPWYHNSCGNIISNFARNTAVIVLVNSSFCPKNIDEIASELLLATAKTPNIPPVGRPQAILCSGNSCFLHCLLILSFCTSF